MYVQSQVYINMWLCTGQLHTYPYKLNQKHDLWVWIVCVMVDDDYVTRLIRNKNDDYGNKYKQTE